MVRPRGTPQFFLYQVITCVSVTSTHHPIDAASDMSQLLSASPTSEVPLSVISRQHSGFRSSAASNPLLPLRTLMGLQSATSPWSNVSLCTCKRSFLCLLEHPLHRQRCPKYEYC
ncbi:hypothetical protein M427DRAFT_367473 [Gonapodya prolifera JEL478]|uniref:Uncharacterized protein n=1 Tax=Gonapodya prolifera (strain JEL478) TaxID=1344416 RepID=A0A139AAD8_GONPJ|nr:hypothetical protein M427DRAFT_367473 [Gonapodya prolifera JEL478]|eukprot:KXS13465.1 hypothetical protein M427DRAFT_367473 [Gonapodya prolifera JEL478]